MIEFKDEKEKLEREKNKAAEKIRLEELPELERKLLGRSDHSDLKSIATNIDIHK